MKGKVLFLSAVSQVSGQWECALLSGVVYTKNFGGRLFPGITCHGRGPVSHLSLADPCCVHVCGCPCGWLDLSPFRKMDEMLDHGHYLMLLLVSPEAPRGLLAPKEERVQM